jgi:hypothetical protein
MAMAGVRNLIRFVLGISLLGGIASAIAAAVAKGRLASRGTETDDEIDLVTIYDGLEFESRAAAFRGGSVLCWYAGVTLDLRAARLDPAGATLNVRAIFGGMQLVVPPSLRVENRIRSVLGGVGDVRDPVSHAGDGPTLTLEGFAAFGGVGVTTEARTEDREPAPMPAESA